MGSRSCGRVLPALPLLLLFAYALSTFAGAQGLPALPGPSDPSNQSGCSKEGGAVPLSSGMFAPWLPHISNLEFGFLYDIGPNLCTGRLTVDYLYPVRLGSGSVLFGEGHGEFQNFWKSPPVSTDPGSTNFTANDRTDLSFGGGFRKLFGESAFIGVNGFYDTTKLFDQWYPAGGVGLEMAALGPGDTAVDLNFNYYGNIFNSEGLRNAFRNVGGSWDMEAGVSTSLFNDAFDLRVKLNAYQFNIGESVFGWRTGADLTTRDAMFTVRYEHGNDRVNGPYDTMGGFVKAGFQVENLFRGENPFSMPEPIFASPRNLLWLLTQKVKRNWHQPALVVLARSTQGCTLPGFRVVRSAINQFTLIPVDNPPILISTASAVTVYWCGYKGPEVYLFEVIVGDDHAGWVFHNTATPPHIAGEAGSLDLPFTSNAGSPPNTVVMKSALPTLGPFISGGGVSFVVNP